MATWQIMLLIQAFSTLVSLGFICAFLNANTVSNSSFDNSKSSLLVPDLAMSIAGKMRFSCIARDNTSSMFPVPLNSS